MFALAKFLNAYVKRGSLTVIDSTGRTYNFSGAPGPEVEVRLHTWDTPLKLFLNPSLYLGEAYMDGSLTINKGNVYTLLELVLMNSPSRRGIWPNDLIERWKGLVRFVTQNNTRSKSRRNVAHHYDLSSDLYKLFLDPDLQYTCGYYKSKRDDMDTAQMNKMIHVLSKLDIQPEHKVLDIGCGWGGLSLLITRLTGANVTGISLSKEQLDEADSRAAAEGVINKVDFKLCDYRDLKDKFDRIVSVGMLEHVGAPFYGPYFLKIAETLNEKGVALIHFIGRSHGAGPSNAWVNKYIFPGGALASLSEIVPRVEESGMYITDIEVWRGHYAETLCHWRERFMENWSAARDMFDERFCRMWEFYLASMEAMFRGGGYVVFQVQLSKVQDALPITRDYMVDWERSISEKDAAA